MNTKSILSLSAVAAALALLVAPLATEVSAWSFGGFDQVIKQKQYSSTSQSCTSVGTVITSTGNCASATTQTNTNTGSNVIVR